MSSQCCLSKMREKGREAREEGRLERKGGEQGGKGEEGEGEKECGGQVGAANTAACLSRISVLHYNTA